MGQVTKARIGFVETPREIIVELSDSIEPDKFKSSLEAAVNNQKVKLFWVQDRMGRSYGIALDNLAFVEVDPQAGDSQIGFGSA